MNVRIDGAKVRELRRERAIERRELEELSGVHYITLSRIEGGKNRSVRLSTAKKIAGALGVAHSEIAGEEVRNARRARVA